MSVTINPMLTTNDLGSFSVESDGLVQGVAMDDPATRFALAAGYLKSDETLPMWGGVGIFEFIPLALTGPLGGQVGRALLLTGNKALTGFSVFNQAHAMINSPQSPVPLAGIGASVNLYRLGSGARIAVKMDPALVNLDGTLITSQVSWDFTGQQLVKYVAAYNAQAITVATWSAGVATYTVGSTAAYATGDTLSISGITPSGYNGDRIITVASGTTFTAPIAVDPGGAGSVFGQVDAGGGALPCKILRIKVGNCKTVVYDPVTGFATWNNDGSAAVIQI